MLFHKNIFIPDFLLKTDSWYPDDTGVTLFTLASPGNPLRYHTHWSALPVSALAHSKGARGPVHQFHILEHRDTYGQAQVCSKGPQGSSEVRGKRRAFSPGAAARHSLSARVHVDFPKKHFSPNFFGLSRLNSNFCLTQNSGEFARVRQGGPSHTRALPRKRPVYAQFELSPIGQKEKKEGPGLQIGMFTNWSVGKPRHMQCWWVGCLQLLPLISLLTWRAARVASTMTCSQLGLNGYEHMMAMASQWLLSGTSTIVTMWPRWGEYACAQACIWWLAIWSRVDCIICRKNPNRKGSGWCQILGNKFRPIGRSFRRKPGIRKQRDMRDISKSQKG